MNVQKGTIVVIKKLIMTYTIKSYLYIILGAILVGLAYNVFMLPAKLAAGGMSGISTIVYEVSGFSPALFQFLVNVPIFIVGWFTLGTEFSMKSLVGTFTVPLVIFLTSDIPVVVTSPLLATIYGGVILGTGLGIVYRGNGSTGGTAALAQVLKKFTGLSSGYSQLIIDGIVAGISLFVFNLELTLFALLCIYITSKAIDFIQLGTSATKLILIISDKREEQRIQTFIQQKIDRGLTKVNSVGGYSNEDKTMILCVAEQSEAVTIKKAIEKEEPTAFVVFINASDIMGRGFSLDKYYGQKL